MFLLQENFSCLQLFFSSKHICTTSFHQLYKPLSEKTGVNASRPGNFLFACDECLTNYEINQEQSDNNKFEKLQSQVNNLAKGMNEIKNMLSCKPVDSVTNTKGFSNAQSHAASGNHNAWGLDNSAVFGNTTFDKSNDSSMVTKIKNSTSIEYNDSDKTTSVLVIDKFENEGVEKENMKKVEKVIVDQNIDIENSYKNKLGKTVIVCKSIEQRDDLKSQISSVIPALPLKSVGNLNKSVVVAGFNNDYTEDNIVDTLLSHNHFISDFIALKSSSLIDNHISVVTVKPLKNDANLSQVVLRISPDLRELITKNGDKLRVGMKRCPVYNRFFVKRCFGCQQYGHFHAQCPTKNIFSCSNCAGDHESRVCEASSSDHRCVNCMRAGKTDINHTASSLSCPVFVNELNKVKSNSKN